MDRRAFLAGAAALLAAPFAAGAQPGKVFLIGFLTASSNNADAPLVERLRQGMRELGYEERQSIPHQRRWAERRLDLVPRRAAELTALHSTLRGWSTA